MSEFTPYNSYNNNNNNNQASYNAGAGGYIPGSQGRSPQRDTKIVDPPLFSLCVKHALGAVKSDTDNRCKIEDKPVHKVKLVGNILQVEVKAGYTIYTLDDGTGIISCNGSEIPVEGVKENVYVSIYGSLNKSSTKPNNHVQIFVMNRITDFNEVTFHMLDSLKSMLMLRQANRQPGMSMGMSSMDNNMNMNNSNNNSTGGLLTSANVGMTSSSNNLRDLVLDIHRRVGETSEGIAMKNVMAQLPQFSGQEVNAMILNLADEGLLYSTIDDVHYKCTD